MARTRMPSRSSKTAPCLAASTSKGFGQEVPSTQFDIEAFFAPFGPTNAVRLRRTEDKLFKSSVFVEFETEEIAKKFIETDPKPQFNGKELQIMSKKEYCDKKVDDIKAGKIKPNTARGGRRDDRRGGRDFKRKRDDEGRPRLADAKRRRSQERFQRRFDESQQQTETPEVRRQSLRRSREMRGTLVTLAIWVILTGATEAFRSSRRLRKEEITSSNEDAQRGRCHC